MSPVLKGSPIALLLAALAVAAGQAQAAEAPISFNTPERLEQFRTTSITTQKLADDLHVLFGVGGNILASIGPQGVLTVDSQFEPLVAKYQATIRELGGGPIDFTINTHGHFDHVDGNRVLGPAGTRLFAHENARQLMMRDIVVNLVTTRIDQRAYPAAALPVATYDRQMRLAFNGRTVDLLHFGPAHTTGDTAVIVQRSGSAPQVVHLGDVYNNAGYPFIDVDNGGSLEGVIVFCQSVLARLDPDAIVVPGHGPVTDYAKLKEYVDMLLAVRDRISALIAGGATLEQVVAAKPTAPWDAAKGNPAGFVNRAYTSLRQP